MEPKPADLTEDEFLKRIDEMINKAMQTKIPIIQKTINGKLIAYREVRDLYLSLNTKK